jgi:hypothetical protein
VKLLLVLFLASASALNASADLIIYKSKLTYTVSNGRATTQGSFTGYVVYDTVSGEIVVIKDAKPPLV